MKLLESALGNIVNSSQNPEAQPPTPQPGSTTSAGQSTTPPLSPSEEDRLDREATYRRSVQPGNPKEIDSEKNTASKLSKRSKQQLATIIEQTCALQKQYGKTTAEMETLVEGFYWALNDCKIEDIIEAFRAYTKTESDIPAPADIIKIIDENKRQKTAETYVKPAKWPREEREENIRQATSEYVKRFMETSPLAAEAMQGKWYSSLLDYVTCVAGVQAQIIHKSNGIGYDARAIFGRTHSIPDEQKAQFFTDQRQQASIGVIGVYVPNERLDDWKHQAMLKERIAS